MVANATHSAGRFVLKTEPDGPLTVEVDGFIVLPISGAAMVWSYDASTRTVTFEPLFRPAPGSTVRISYGTTCH